MPPSAIDRHAGRFGGLGGLVNRRDLRNADARNHPRRADRPGPDADFDGVGAGGDQVAASLGGGDVAGHDVDIPTLLDLLDRLDHVGRMAVGTVDDQHVDVFGDQAFGPLVVVHADGRPDPQPPLPIFAGIGKPLHHVDVFDRNQPGQSVIFVNQQKFLDLICHQNLLSFLKRYGPRGSHQVLAGHDLGDFQVAGLRETAGRGG